MQHTFAGADIIFTTSLPAPGTEYSTIYIGGDDLAFSSYGSFLGLAEQADVGNVDYSFFLRFVRADFRVNFSRT